MTEVTIINSEKQPDILIIDDMPQNLRLLMKILTEEGYNVRPANHGHAALMTIEAKLPDLILLDIQMPDMDGYEVCKRLKANPNTAHIPVLFISARDEVFDKVRAFQVGGVDYITKPFQTEEVLARVQTHMALQQALRSLEDSNADLEAFAHTVAHDLKSPLGIITGFGELMSTQLADQGDAQLSRHMEIITQTAFKMNQIILDLLLLASVRKEEIELDNLVMDVVIGEVEKRLLTLVEGSDAQIIKPTQWPQAMGVASWIEEVWANYISNGIKYGGEPPIVELGGDAQADGMVRFWVRDNGAGLTPETKAQLFNEFGREKHTRAQGHGLGLSIVKRIIEKQGGTVGVDCVSDGGCTFYFTLPGTPQAEKTAVSPAPTTSIPPRDTLLQLLADVQRGDVTAVTHTAEQIKQQNKAWHPFVQHLNQLATSYQMEKLEQWLTSLL